MGCAVTSSATIYPSNCSPSCHLIGSDKDSPVIEPLLNPSNHASQSVIRGWRVRTRTKRAYKIAKMFSEKQHTSEEMLPLNLIRQYSQIFRPRDISSYYHLAMLSDSPTARTEVGVRREECQDLRKNPSISGREKESDLEVREWTRTDTRSLTNARVELNCVPLLLHPGVPLYAPAINPSLRSSLSRELSNSHSALLRRHRGEKKAIPEEQKDGKYFERRKRNNEAAKRSRDARKLREDRVRALGL